MEIIFDEKKAMQIFAILENLYRERSGLYGIVKLPQNTTPLPENNPQKLANWFFAVAHFMRGGVLSDTQTKIFRHLLDACPEIFDPEEIYQNWTPSKILETLKTIVPKFNGSAASPVGVLGFMLGEHLKNWHYNFSILRICWQSDARNVFEGVNDFEEAVLRAHQRHNGFLGMRRKILSLLTIWLQEKNLIHFFPAPIPVDFHALRILLQTEIVKIKNLKGLKFNPRYPFLARKKGVRVTEAMVNQITLWTQRFLWESGFSHAIINPALWIIGRELCAGHFQASSKNSATIYVDAKKLMVNPGMWPQKYRNPCEFCPIENFCTGVVPNAPYYRWGLLVIFPRIPFKSSTILFAWRPKNFCIRLWQKQSIFNAAKPLAAFLLLVLILLLHKLIFSAKMLLSSSCEPRLICQ